MSGLTEAQLALVAETIEESGTRVQGGLVALPISGGRSNLTYRLSDEATTWVMRTPPWSGSTPSAHDVAREFRVMTALAHAGFAVPAPVALCTDDTRIGVSYAVVEFVAGRTIQTKRHLDEFDHPAVVTLAERLVEKLASLHAIDHRSIGLSDFGRSTAYVSRQLVRWASQWEIVAPSNVSDLGRGIADRLSSGVPKQRHAAVIHGDFRIDNTILSVEGDRSVPPTIAAVVDWELSTIGDPVADVAMMCAYRNPAFDLIVGEESAWTSDRLPGPSDLAHSYETAGGAPLDHWDFHLALAHFKVAVIAAGISHRSRSGGLGGKGFDTASESIEPYLRTAASILAHA